MSHIRKYKIYQQPLHGVVLQKFQPDLFLCDFVMMDGGVLADKLGIPKAMMIIPAHLPPQTAFDYGSGSHLLATVPQWQSLLPRNMVCAHGLSVCLLALVAS